MKKLKVLAYIVGSIMIIFGFTGFLLSFATAATRENGRLVSSLPINEVNGIAVDAKEQIYIGDGQSSSIQVFSNTGEFMYGFTFPTGAGWFTFGIDEKDIIHIVTARTESYFQYINGEPIHSELIDLSRRSLLEKDYNMSDGNSFKAYNKEYSLFSRNQLAIYNIPTNEKKIIMLNTPFWPFPIFTYWLTGAVGMGLLSWSSVWKMIKNISKLFKK